MTTTPIQSSTPTNTTTNPKSSLKAEDFINMMITQLKSQDPTDPAKSDQLLSQMSQIGQLQSSTQLQESLKGLVLQNQIGAASGLIGKSVQGLDSDTNETITGNVTSIKVQDDGVSLELDNGKSLEMARVTSIAGAAAGASSLPTH